MIDDSGTMADFYAFLSRMFLEEPPRELSEDMANGRFMLPAYSSEDFSVGVRLIENFMKEEKDASRMYDDMCSEFTRLFVGPVPAMFPYESMYVDGSMMSDSLIEVKKEYRRAGLKKVNDFHETEDHISMELAFMGYLYRLGSDDSRIAKRDFLHNHLLKWVPGFCDELCLKCRNDFFRGIGKLTRGFLFLERDKYD